LTTALPIDPIRLPQHPEIKRSLAMAVAASSVTGHDGVPVLYVLARTLLIFEPNPT
jgi:hypothetical protein